MFGKLFVLLVITNAAAMVFGVYIRSPYPARLQGKGLTVKRADAAKVEGTYDGRSGTIHFSSTAMNGDHSLTITTAEGRPILVSSRLKDSTVTTMTLGDDKFVAIMNQPGSGLPKYSANYVVPAAFHNHIEFAVKRNRLSNAVLQYFDAVSANATRQRAVEDLISNGQASLIVEAAKALGRSGVMGTENPAARQLYAMARRLDTVRNKMMQIQRAKEGRLDVHSQDSRGLLWFSRRQQKRETCPQCTTGECPYYGDTSNDCFGMCGRNCQCWSFLCGDCCVHQGCLQHDQCCIDYGFWSFECLLAPLDFSCESYSC